MSQGICPGNRLRLLAGVYDTGQLLADSPELPELNTLQLSALRNPDGQSPFVNPAYTLLNLAIGGQAGGDPAAVPFPVHYEVDYVRVYSRIP